MSLYNNFGKKYLQSFIETQNKDVVAQLILSFCLGILFAPFTYGFIYYLIFLILYEIILFAMSKPWNYELRIGVFAFSLIGFIIGRYLVGKKVH